MPIIDGEFSWQIRSKNVTAALTRRGGHLAPVVYSVGKRKFSVFASPPWTRERIAQASPPVLQVMRGDFFCMPFGEPGAPYRGERHLPHGETANATWREVEISAESLHVQIRTRTRRGRVDKYLWLVDGHPAVYSRHVISGMSGPMSLGHHAIVKFGDEGIISTSPFTVGQTFDGDFSDPETGSYSSFKPGALFTSLQKVPTRVGRFTDASRFPSRGGFEDLLQLQSRPETKLGWTAVVFPKERFAWIGLKDTATLPGTVMWFSNGGRHMTPWSGRHRNTAGLEEVCSYFHTGLARSAGENPHRRRGLVTCHHLNRRTPLTINYIMAATPVSGRFDRVTKVTKVKGGLLLVADNGTSQFLPVNVGFLWGGADPAAEPNSEGS